MAATTVYGSLRNERVSRYEVEICKQLTDLVVTAARIHRAPRKRFKRPSNKDGQPIPTFHPDWHGPCQHLHRQNEDEEDVKLNPRRRASFL